MISARNLRRFKLKLVERLSTVLIPKAHSRMQNLDAMLNARCRINIQSLLPNVRIDRVEAFLDPGTMRLLVRIWRDDRAISLHDDPETFPSPSLLAKVVLFAQGP